MAHLDQYLKLDRCPHCAIDNPNLNTIFNFVKTTEDDGSNPRGWKGYVCGRCGGIVTACADQNGQYINATYPTAQSVDDSLPTRVKVYLKQAMDSVFAPSGSVMLCASSVDAMLKEKGYVEGSLYKRIKAATSDGLLTKEMETWAHEVRLDANDERHADENAILPSTEDAKQSIEFTKTLAEFLFILPNKVKRGIEATKQISIEPSDNQ
jgi:hypothetical protein